MTYLDSIHPSDLQIFTTFANPSIGGNVGYDPATNAKILRLPFVQRMETVVGFDGNLAFVHGEHLRIQPGGKPPVFEGPTGGEYTTQDSAHLVAGRFADPNNPHEAIMNAQAAKEMGLHLGSVIQVGLNSDAQEVAMSAPTGPSNLPAARVATVKIVGIVVFPQDVDQNDYNSLGSAEVLFSPAETRQIDRCCAYYSNGALKLVGGSAHLGSVESQLNRLGLALPQVGEQTWAAGDRRRRSRHQARVDCARRVRRAGGAVAALRRPAGDRSATAPARRRNGPAPRARRRPRHNDGRWRRGHHRRGPRRRRPGRSRLGRPVAAVPARTRAPRLSRGRRRRCTGARSRVGGPGDRALRRRRPRGVPA